MTEGQLDTLTYARDNMRTIGQGFAGAADFFEMLSESDWAARTACDKWNMRTLADHILGEAVWFPNLVRNALRGEDMYPMSLYDEMKSWPADQVISRLREAAAEYPGALDGAEAEDMDTLLDMGFAKMPVWRATYINLIEGVVHPWDARASLQPEATIATPWAVQLAAGMAELAPMIAHKKGVEACSGMYLLQVSDGVGPVTVRDQGGTLTVERGASGTPDVTLFMTADQYVRLIIGRLPLDSEHERDRVGIEGNRERAADLNRIFGGIANEA